MKLQRQFTPSNKQTGALPYWDIHVNGKNVGYIQPVNSALAKPDQRYVVRTELLKNGTRHSFFPTIREALIYLMEN
jgi:hypothetical protein